MKPKLLALLLALILCLNVVAMAACGKQETENSKDTSDTENTDSEDTTTEGGDDTTTEGGDDTTTEGGDDTTTEGDDTTTEGDDTTTEGGDGTTAEGGDGTTAEGGDDTTAEGGDGTTAEGGNNESNGNNDGENGGTTTQPITVTVTLDLNGGTLSGAVESLTVGESYDLGTPSREGYTFAGWYHGETPIATTGTWTIANDVSLTATWTAKTYTVTYDAAEGTVANPTTTVTYDAS